MQPCHIQNYGLYRIWTILIGCKTDSNGIIRTVYWSVFKDIKAYSLMLIYIAILTAHRPATRGKNIPSSFWHRKNCPDFGKKCPDFVYLSFKFTIQNLLLRGKFPKCFSVVTLFPSSIPSPPPIPWKISGCATVLRDCYFCKILYLMCLTLFWIRLSRYNCLIICTVTSCYALHQTPFRILGYSAVCFFRYMPTYWITLSANKAYSRIWTH